MASFFSYYDAIGGSSDKGSSGKLRISKPDYITRVETVLAVSFTGKRGNCKKKQTNVHFSLSDLVGNIGGNLGLWLGVYLLDLGRFTKWISGKVQRGK